MITKELLEKLYFEDRMTVDEIKKYLNNSSISYYIKKFGIKTDGAKRNSIKLDKDKLVELYVEKDLTALEVAKELEISVITVVKNLKKFGIKIKGIK